MFLEQNCLHKCISPQKNLYKEFKKEIRILSHIAKKLQAYTFLQNCLIEKAPGSKKSVFFLLFFYIPETVSVVNIISHLNL